MEPYSTLWNKDKKMKIEEGGKDEKAFFCDLSNRSGDFWFCYHWRGKDRRVEARALFCNITPNAFSCRAIGGKCRQAQQWHAQDRNLP